MTRKAIVRDRQHGVSLLELMIVVAIVAIIGAFGYPSYMEHVVSTKRTAATSILLQVADRQQQFFMDNKSYAANLTDLGFAANPLIIADDGNAVAGGDPDATYSVSLGNLSATTFTATAAPLNGQLSRDGDCGSLSLTQAGVRGASGGGDDCW